MPSYKNARGLLAAVLARYRSLAHYADTGHTRLRTPLLDHTVSFSTARGDGGDFRFAFSRPHPYRRLNHVVTRYVAGRHQGQAYFAAARPQQDFTLEWVSGLDMAIAGATGISMGAAHFIGHLLLDEVEGWAAMDLCKPRLRSPRQVDGVPCWRVTGRNRLGQVTPYIGMDDLLVRRRTEKRGRLDERRRDIDIQGVPPQALFAPPQGRPEA